MSAKKPTSSEDKKTGRDQAEGKRTEVKRKDSPRIDGPRAVVGLSTRDRAIDHELALLSGSLRFLLDVTPMNVEQARTEFLATGELPEFVYRDLEDDPEVLKRVLQDIPIHLVDDTVLGNKHKEMSLQLDMLAARDTEDFMPLSIELYGAILPDLRRSAELILETVTATESTSAGSLGAKDLLDLAREEMDHYRKQDPDIEMHAEIRDDVSGVMVSGNSLLLGPESKVRKARAHALLQHEVGTHLVTHFNGSAQPIKILGTGLARYDETQEGLAVLAEVACGGLTAFRLRQLASRVLTVHRGHRGRQAHGDQRVLPGRTGLLPESLRGGLRRRGHR
ncbi:tyrosine/phenylalanine carboxypeptidase domain-containing protein [Citricoccus zhacaiensis]